jgi:nicotinamidase/pyrazinamidase
MQNAQYRGLTLSNSDVLILIDIQNDFMPGGALAVPNGNEIREPVSQLVDLFDNIVLTQDRHPVDHVSFASNHEGKLPFDVIDLHYGPQVLWPDHCVEGTWGAFLDISHKIEKKAQLTIRKGFRRDVDSYSAFFENDKTTMTGLNGYLKDRNIDRVFLAGLALDYCVAYSALDAAALGFDTFVIEEACRGISPETVASQIDAMKAAGVKIL